MNDGMAVCGIDCDHCNLLRAPVDEKAAESLVGWFRAEGWLKEGEGSAEVMKRGPYCAGCRGDRNVQWSGDCWVRACCLDTRHLNNCSECPEFPCTKLTEWGRKGAHHAQALERLEAMRGR